jgi:hypothetical protein
MGQEFASFFGALMGTTAQHSIKAGTPSVYVYLNYVNKTTFSPVFSLHCLQ